jgi:hypothetical protein
MGAAQHHHPSKIKSVERWFFPNYFLSIIFLPEKWNSVRKKMIVGQCIVDKSDNRKVGIFSFKVYIAYF